MPIVRKSKYHQKKQEIQQLKNRNTQLQTRLSQLQAENNRLKNNNSHTHTQRERERERERATSPLLPELSTEREISEQTQSPMPDNNEPDTPATLVGDEEHFPDNSKLITLLNERNEQLDHAENWIKTLQIKLDYQQQEYSDYHFKGEYEIQRLRHLLSSSEIQLREKREKIISLVLELDQVENQFRVHQITFNEIVRQRDGSLEKLGEISYLLEQEVLRNQINYETLKSVVLEREKLVKTLIAKQQKLVNYWKNLQKYKNFNQQYQKELKLRTENENLLTIRFQQLQNYYQKKKTQNQELTIQLEEKETTINHQNQIINELENEITDFQTQLTENRLHLNFAHQDIEKLSQQKAKEKIIAKSYQELKNSLAQSAQTDRDNYLRALQNKQEKITDLESELTKEEELVDIKDKRIDNLTETITKLNSKNNSLKIQLTYHEDQDPKLRDTIRGLQSHTYPPCSLPHLPAPHRCPIVQQVNCSHSDYDSLKTKLAEKENIIQQQAQRIRELENKPPLVETKTVEKEVVKEVEKPIERLIEVESSQAREEIKRLKTIIQELEQQLAHQPTLIKTEQVKVPSKISSEVWVLRGLLLGCILIGLALLVQKIKKASKKVKGK